MKLKNKKTGEIGYLIASKGISHYLITNDEWDKCGEYYSLTEINEEWEDYEEPKKYWYVSRFGYVVEDIDEDFDADKKRKEIGNYFETEEEAKKVVEKLKAWKRLKDKGFKITLRDCNGYAYLEANWGNLQGDYSDVIFLFGGKNESNT